MPFIAMEPLTWFIQILPALALALAVGSVVLTLIFGSTAREHIFGAAGLVMGLGLFVVFIAHHASLKDEHRDARDSAVAKHITSTYGLDIDVAQLEYPDTKPVTDDAVFGDALARPINGDASFTVSLVWVNDHFALFRDGAPLPTTAKA